MSAETRPSVKYKRPTAQRVQVPKLEQTRGEAVTSTGAVRWESDSKCSAWSGAQIYEKLTEDMESLLLGELIDFFVQERSINLVEKELGLLREQLKS